MSTNDASNIISNMTYKLNKSDVTIIKLKESPKNCIPKGADHPPKSSVIGR